MQVKVQLGNQSRDLGIFWLKYYLLNLKKHFHHTTHTYINFNTSSIFEPYPSIHIITWCSTEWSGWCFIFRWGLVSSNIGLWWTQQASVQMTENENISENNSYDIVIYLYNLDFRDSCGCDAYHSQTCSQYYNQELWKKG